MNPGVLYQNRDSELALYIAYHFGTIQQTAKTKSSALLTSQANQNTPSFLLLYLPSNHGYTSLGYGPVHSEHLISMAMEK